MRATLIVILAALLIASAQQATQTPPAAPQKNGAPAKQDGKAFTDILKSDARLCLLAGRASGCDGVDDAQQDRFLADSDLDANGDG